MKKGYKKMQVRAAALDSALDTAGEIQDIVNAPVSTVVNGITRSFNKATQILGSEPLLEDDPTGPVEAVTEGLNIAGDSLRAINANLQELVGLDPRVAKELIKLGEAGDRVCDQSKGDIRMTIEFPGFNRQFNACIDMKTARNLANQIVTEPVKPLINFAECALSESILKPVDHVVRDVKNGFADLIRAIINPAQLVPNIRNGAQNVIDAVQKGFAGSYLITPSPDSLVCFQAKTNDVDYKTVNVNDVFQGLMSLEWITGGGIKPTPFSRNDDRDVCRV